MSVALILLYVLGFSIFAHRHWFTSLCALLLLTAVLEHPVMPRHMFGIQGFNPWNVLLVNVVLGWLRQRRRDGFAWDLPPFFSVMIALYVAIMVVSFARMIVDRGGIEEFTTVQLVSEYLINPVKWLIPGLLLFDGCRTRQRRAWGLLCTLAIYIPVALLVIHSMPSPGTLSGLDLMRQSRTLMSSSTGYYPTTLSTMLAGAAWAILAAAPVLATNAQCALAIAATAVVIYAQALTAGRMGYLTWIAVGVILSSLRRHKLFLAAPVLALATLFVVRGATERMVQGINDTTTSGERRTDYNQVTSGRLVAWSLVIEKIREAPLIGHGRLAMQRTGIWRRMLEEYHDTFPHPHNAYLEWVLDNGLIGLLLLAPFYAALVVSAARMFRNRGDPWGAFLGGATLALTLSLLIAAFSGETFYPREATIGMWACIGLCLRSLSEHETPSARHD